MTKTETKVFQSGNSQAVRIPKEFQMNCEVVSIERDGDSIVITPKKKESWAEFFNRHERGPDDFMDFDRSEEPVEREYF